MTITPKAIRFSTLTLPTCINRKGVHVSMHAFVLAACDDVADRGCKFPDHAAVCIQIQSGSVLSAAYHAAVAVADIEGIGCSGDLLALYLVPVPVPVLLQNQDALHLGGDGLEFSATVVGAFAGPSFPDGCIGISVVVIIADFVGTCGDARCRRNQCGGFACSADGAAGESGQQGSCCKDGCEDSVGFHKEKPLSFI